MNKKKVGELEGTPIVIGKKNYANEHEYYMTLNGDNTYQKLEQRTNGDQFKLVLGGGSDSGSDSNSILYIEPFTEEEFDALAEVRPSLEFAWKIKSDELYKHSTVAIDIGGDFKGNVEYIPILRIITFGPDYHPTEVKLLQLDENIYTDLPFSNHICIFQSKETFDNSSKAVLPDGYVFCTVD